MALPFAYQVTAVIVSQIPAMPVSKMGKGWFIRQAFLIKVLANLQENKINEKSLNSRAKGIIPLFTCSC